MKTLFVLILTWITFASAAERIGEIDCHTLDRPVSYMIRADIFGKRLATGWRPEYVNISLTSYNWNSHRETKPLRIWQMVPNMNDRNFSEHFNNKEVELEAFYDDVGAMSSIIYKGKEYQLACDIDFK
jgi:hypothetical protein